MTADDKANGYHRCLFRRFFAGGREWGNCSFSYSSDTHVSLSKKIWWFDGLENARMTKVLRKGNRPNSEKMNLGEKRNGPEPRRRMSALTSVHFSARRQLQQWAHQDIPSQVKKTYTQSHLVIPTRADVKIMLSLFVCSDSDRSVWLILLTLWWPLDQDDVSLLRDENHRSSTCDVNNRYFLTWKWRLEN